MEYNHTRHAKKTWLNTEPFIDLVGFFLSSYPSIFFYRSLCFADRELHQGEHEGRDGSAAAERRAQPHGSHVGNGHEPSLPDGWADAQTYRRWNTGKDSEMRGIQPVVTMGCVFGLLWLLVLRNLHCNYSHRFQCRLFSRCPFCSFQPFLKRCRWLKHMLGKRIRSTGVKTWLRHWPVWATWVGRKSMTASKINVHPVPWHIHMKPGFWE